jgi:hypothetical protein
MRLAMTRLLRVVNSASTSDRVHSQTTSCHAQVEETHPYRRVFKLVECLCAFRWGDSRSNVTTIPRVSGDITRRDILQSMPREHHSRPNV